MVVGLRVLVLREVERRRVLHQPHADPVGEQIAEQALEEGREAGEPLASDRDAELQRHEPAQVPPLDHATRLPYPHRGDDPIDDQLTDPEDGQRDE